jgi:TetR/AcrR family transcriptional regulator
MTMKPSEPLDVAHGTRTAVLREAVRLFAERGYAGATVRDISEASGVTTPVIYYHFGSKEGLYAAVKRHMIGLSEALEAPPADGPFDLASEVVRMFEFCRDHPELLRIGAWSRLEGEGLRAGEPPRSGPIASLGRRIASAQVDGQVRDDIDADHLATMLIGLVVFRLERRLADQDESDDEAYVRQAIGLLDRGLAPSQPAQADPA